MNSISLTTKKEPSNFLLMVGAAQVTNPMKRASEAALSGSRFKYFYGPWGDETFDTF